MHQFAFRGVTRVIAIIEILLGVLRLAVVGTAFGFSVYIMNNREARKEHYTVLPGLWMYCFAYGPEAILYNLAAFRLLRSTFTNIDPDVAWPLAHFWRQITTLTLIILIIPFIFMLPFFLVLLPISLPLLLAIIEKGICLFIVSRGFIPELENANELNDQEDYLKSRDPATFPFQFKEKGESKCNAVEVENSFVKV